MAIVTVGIDLAKNAFAVHDVDETGKAVLVRPDVSRAKLMGPKFVVPYRMSVEQRTALINRIRGLLSAVGHRVATQGRQSRHPG